jgi:hypothetical protein
MEVRGMFLSLSAKFTLTLSHLLFGLRLILGALMFLEEQQGSKFAGAASISGEVAFLEFSVTLGVDSSVSIILHGILAGFFR